ncbi:MAG: peptidylprolyl isomerase [Alphaproteobacteria bacterium]
MTVLRTVASLGVAALCALSVAAGSAPAGAQDGEAKPEAKQDAEAPAALPPDATVATIDGQPVTAGEVRVAFQFLPQQYYFLPAEFLFETVLKEMIDVKLMAAAANAEGLATPEIERQVVFYRERLLRQAYLKKRADAEITPDVIKQRYEAMIAEAQPQDEVRAHHILVESEDEAKALADQLAKGADFEALAKEKSIDETSAEKGGDLGYFTKDKMVAPFAEAAFATEPGKLSAPVQTQFGWHLIRVDDRRQAKPPTLEEVVPQLRDELVAELVSRASGEVRAERKVEIGDNDPYAVLGLPRPPPAAEAPDQPEGATDAPADAPTGE